MWLTAQESLKSVLKASGLEGPKALLTPSLGTAVRRGGGTLTRRIPLNGLDVYVKQYHHGLRYLLRKSRARVECENLRRLSHAGLPVPEVLAAGEERTSLWTLSAFIVTSAIPESTSLDLVMPGLWTESDTGMRRRLIRTLADLVARMHRAGFVHHDLHWRNILVGSRSGEGFRISLIDCPRGTWPRTRRRQRAGQARDLACLDRRAVGVLSRTERLRFLLNYLGRDRLTDADRDLLVRIERRSRTLRRRHQRSARKRTRKRTFCVAPKFADVLEQAGLAGFRELLDDTTAEILDGHSRRSVARLRLDAKVGTGGLLKNAGVCRRGGALPPPGTSGSAQRRSPTYKHSFVPDVFNSPTVTFYLKRFGPRHLKDDLASLVRLRRPVSLAEAEWQALTRMRAAGLPVPECVAWGEERRFGRAVSSLILIAEIPGEQLDLLLQQGALTAPTRRELSGALGRLIRKAHDIGFSMPDLYAKHIFVEVSRAELSVHIIDVQRVEQVRRLSWRRRSADVAALNASLPTALVGVTERLRFLLAYFGRARLEQCDRTFIGQIMRRTAVVVRRRHIPGWQTQRYA